ncbi:TetR family transcriptional regulator [Klugiella xanthotipulae]|uniref:TetR family transcriptional regulator n=2 Tax=Klugiella xanthotipulae TaxID=244735 RepID=A0A543HY54_9MICO|nr:TetR family transcriptional regulator [Klugiella xanthotipulae]
MANETTTLGDADAAGETARRAQPLGVEDRRAMIIGAVTPLLMEQGFGVTSKQLADAAGLAEGTIFRAFGDKQSLLRAVTERYLDPEPFREELSRIDRSLPLEVKVRTVIHLMRERFGSVFRLVAAVGPGERPEFPSHRAAFDRLVGDLLDDDREQLMWPPATVAHIIRLMTFASTLPRLNEDNALSLDDLTSIVLYGIAGTPASASTDQPIEEKS